jgi:DNA-nicking Smr family endonuclease
MRAGAPPPRRGRKLSGEELALWRDVTKSVARMRPAAPPDAAAEEKIESAAAPPASPLGPARKQSHVAAKPAPPPLAPLDRRFRQRLARGTHPIEARIDLHGMTQNEAHTRLLHFVRNARAGGATVALVITGKGARAGDEFAGRGVLFRQVPLWLGQPEFREHIVGFERAHVAHGGEGALYVRLRRAR